MGFVCINDLKGFWVACGCGIRIKDQIEGSGSSLFVYIYCFCVLHLFDNADCRRSTCALWSQPRLYSPVAAPLSAPTANVIFFFSLFSLHTKKSNSKLMLLFFSIKRTSLCGSSAFILSFIFSIYCWTTFFALLNVAQSLLFLSLIEMCKSMTTIFMRVQIYHPSAA